MACAKAIQCASVRKAAGGTAGKKHSIEWLEQHPSALLDGLLPELSPFFLVLQN